MRTPWLIRPRIRPRIRRAILACLIVSLAAPALAACAGSSTTGGGSTSTPATPVISKDALGNPISIPATAPQRIVSLTPADSEILAAVGADAHVVAVDNFSDYPASMAAKPKISGADGKFNVERIVGLQPDLVLGAGGETPDVDKQLGDAHITVVDLPIATNLGDILNDITLVGQLVHADPAAARLGAALRARIEAVKQKVADLHPVSTYVELDYSTPGKPFVFGGGSFGDEVIRDAGGSNVFGNNTSGQGFPQVSDESVIAANPQVIVLTEDPQFGGTPQAVYARGAWSGIAAVKNKRVYGMDPNIISRPGPRIVDALEQMAKLLHPEAFK
jgi:ABC-type Fe3+-hydroxamate transport system substrate-binding protein